MQSVRLLLATIKSDGHRFTKIREAILDILLRQHTPLSVGDITKALLRKHIKPNKTTVYRELALLKEKKLVRELQFDETKKRYEIMPENHHHHLVCMNCDVVEDVELADDLKRQEQLLSQKNNFKILNHALEFYGLCARCKRK